MADVSSSFEMFSLFCFIERNLLNLYSFLPTLEVERVPSSLAKICQKFLKHSFYEVHTILLLNLLRKQDKSSFMASMCGATCVLQWF